jgi:hypothetical protein
MFLRVYTFGSTDQVGTELAFGEMFLNTGEAKMKLIKVLRPAVLAVSAAVVPLGYLTVQAAPALVFNTTFDCPEWNQTGGGDPCSSGDGIGRAGDWTSSSGKGDQITAATNNPLGSGRGMRHWRGAGTNNQGGGVTISFPPSSQLWVRWYARYSAGFSWRNGSPQYTKDLYFHAGEAGAMIAGFSNGSFYVHSTAGSQNLTSSRTWSAINGGSVGDGKFHAYEIYIKLDSNGSNGAVKMWVDGQLVGDRSGLDLGTRGPFSSFALGENQNEVTNGEHYTDFDDVAISHTGYIGPIGGGATTPTLPVPAAPTSLRIVR